MKRFGLSKLRWVGLVFLVLAAGAGVVAWAEWEELETWYVLRGIRQSSDAELPGWNDKAAAVGQPVLPDVLAMLEADNPQERARAEDVLIGLCTRWGADDPQTDELAQRLVRTFAHRDATGHSASLRIARSWFTPRASDRLAAHAGRLLVETGPAPESAVLREALALAVFAARQEVHPETRHALRALAQRGFKAEDSANRLQAIELADLTGMDCTADLMAFIGDPSPEVRRAALCALLPRGRGLSTDALVPWLHDEDGAVRDLCERALRQRGLSGDSLRLARLISDKRWTARLEVLDHLEDVPELDPAVWLRRLTHDPAPAVRLAAVRAASEAHLDGLADRLEEMSRADPSPTVADLARHYRRRQAEMPAAAPQ